MSGRRVAAGAAAVLAVAVGAAAPTGPACAADPGRSWTSPGDAKIRPGIVTETAGAV